MIVAGLFFILIINLTYRLAPVYLPELKKQANQMIEAAWGGQTYLLEYDPWHFARYVVISLDTVIREILGKMGGRGMI